jgi:hypothetical protein
VPAPWLELIKEKGLKAAKPAFTPLDDTHSFRYAYLYLEDWQGPIGGLQVLHKHVDGTYCGGDLTFDHHGKPGQVVWTPVQMTPIWLKEPVRFPCGDRGRIVSGTWVGEMIPEPEDDGVQVSIDDYFDSGV